MLRLSTVMMALNVVGVPLMVAETVAGGGGGAPGSLKQPTNSRTKARRRRRIRLDLSTGKRTAVLKIGQVLQYFAVHFVVAERFVEKAVKTMVLEVLVHILIYG